MRCNARMQAETETPLGGVRACLEQFSHTVGIARSLVQAGRRVDLAGLEGEMGFICARTLDLPPEQGRGLRPALLALRAELDALLAALTARAPPAG